jgi:uncharacterized protein (DUF305 family)
VLAVLLLWRGLAAVTRRRLQPPAGNPPAAPLLQPPTRPPVALGMARALGRRAAPLALLHARWIWGVDLDMRRILIALAAAVLLAACAHSAATQPAASTAAFNDADVAFLQDMIPHHRQAIAMAELVDGRTRRPELVELAAGITASRDAEIRTMQGFLSRWNRPAPAAGAPEQEESQVLGMLGQGQLDWLQTLAGVQFDLGFVTMLRTHHEGAVELAKAELGAGASAAVKALARQMIAAQQAEIRQLHRWKDAWS